jgi:hypothetical protein
MLARHPQEPLPARARPNFITLSPKRNTKNKFVHNSHLSKLEIEKEQSVSYLNSEADANQQQPLDDELPLRQEQSFRPIPRYRPDQLSIRHPNTSGLEESRSQRKKKLSVTKLFQNVEISNRSQDGSSGKAEVKMRDFD